MFDWHKSTADPMNAEVMQKLRSFLLSIRSVAFVNRDGYLLSECADKTVLDIGPCEHTIDYIQHENWFFGRAQKVASRITGVDINKALCEQISDMGFDVRHMDACSNAALGEKFDVVLAGDVIEHVNDLVSLLNFAKRHLTASGKIIVTTPNPFFYRYFLANFRKGLSMINFEHTCWITPTCMNELCRRSGLALTHYVMVIKPRSFKHYMMKLLPFTKSWIEGLSKEYIYILKSE